MKIKEILNGLVWSLLSVPFIVISFMTILMLALYTNNGKAHLLSKIEEILENRTGYVVHIQDIQCDLFSEFKIKSIVVSREYNEILSLKNIEVNWSIRDLAQFKFKINTLKIEKIEISNKLDLPERNNKEHSFSIESIRWPIEIDQLEISSFHIEPGVISQVGYNASVFGELNFITGDLSLDLKTIEGPTTALTIEGKRIEDKLELDITGQEKPDGMIAGWLGIDTQEHSSKLYANVIINSTKGKYFLNISKMQANIAGHQFDVKGHSEFSPDFRNIRFTDLNVSIDKGRISGTGIYEREHFALSAIIENISTDFFKIAHFPVKQGCLNGVIEGKGTVANPTISVDLTLAGVAEVNQEIKNFDLKMILQGTVQSKEIKLDAKILNSKNALGTLSVKLPWPNIPINTKKQNLSGLITFDFELEPIFQLLPYIDHQLKGHMTGDLILRGNYTKPTFKGQFKVQDGEYQYLEKDFQLRNIQVEAFFLDNGQIEVTHMMANAGKGEIQGQGNYSKTKQSFSLILKNLPTTLLSMTDLPFKESTLDGRIDYHGTFENPILNAALEMSGLYAYDEKHNKVTVDFNINANIQNQIFQLITTINSHSKVIGDIILTADWKRLRDYQNQTTKLGEAHFNIDLSSIGSILKLEYQKISGALKGDLALKGSLLSPNINGQITLKEGQYQHNKAGISLHNISLVAVADSQKINIQMLSGQDDREGTIQLAGYIEWPNQTPYIVLQGYLNDMHLINTANMSGDLKGPVVLKGHLNHLLLSGNLELSPLEIDLDRNISKSIPEIKVITREAYLKRFERQSSTVNIIDFDIGIRAPKRIFISGNGLEAELAGNLKITGNSHKQIFEGALNTIRGQYEFLNKKFKITSGKIWIERNKLILDITATTKASNLVATVNIRGATDDIQFSISSSPALPQDEIISKILFGRDIKRLSPFQAIQLANALSNLSKDQGRTVDLGILNKTKKLLQVDTFNVDANEKSEVTVGVGKYLTDDAYLQLQQGTTTQETQAIVEIELTPSISLESTTNASDTTVGDLKIIWRHDY